MTDLFNSGVERGGNLLPCDGTVIYCGKMLSEVQSQSYFEKLMSGIAWKNDQALIYGKLITTKRKVAWYADRPFSYTYSGTTREALPWTDELLDLKLLVEGRTGLLFNSCLLNLYHNGEEGMSWHSDDEKELVKHAGIASLSLGAERKFMFKHQASGARVDVVLENGSLLVMKDETQEHWLHSLPKSKKVKGARISLTFRIMRG